MFSCSLAIVNPLILTEHTCCVVHRDIRHYNDPVTRLPKVTSMPVNVYFHPSVSFVPERYPVFSPTDLTVPPIFFHFLNTEHLSLRKQEFRCFTVVGRVDKHG